MPSEQQMWRDYVRPMLASAGLDPVRVENAVHPGTPDVNYVPGWIELKYVKQWPYDENKTPLRVPHFTPQQRVWLRRRWQARGNAFLLLRVHVDWMLFDGATAAKIVGHVPILPLMEQALAACLGVFVPELFLPILTNTSWVSINTHVHHG